MRSFYEALTDGFERKDPGYFSFQFGPEKEYELAFEPLLFDNQWYVALYEQRILLTEKVVIKPGKEE